MFKRIEVIPISILLLIFYQKFGTHFAHPTDKADENPVKAIIVHAKNVIGLVTISCHFILLSIIIGCQLYTNIF